MFIIFGNNHNNKLLGRTKQMFKCRNCNNTNNYNIISEEEKLTLFFVPTIPLNSKTRMECPICRYGRYITDSEAQALLSGESINISEANNNSDVDNRLGKLY